MQWFIDYAILMYVEVIMKTRYQSIYSFLQDKSYIIASFVVFFFFLFISTKTPLAGDDWGYALNGMKHNPFQLAFSFYFDWSGRFFSELYGFLVTPNKWFWNALNALLFSSIYLSIIRLSGSEKKPLAHILLIFLMLSVKDELRMETYSWLMGTTYVIPLALYLIYIQPNLNHLRSHEKQSLLLVIILSIITFIGSFMMENASVLFVLTNILLICFDYISRRKASRVFVLYFAISVIALILIRVSPGASARLLRDHKAWIDLGIFGQILRNYPLFIRYTFIEHRYLILAMSVFSGLNIVIHSLKHKTLKLTAILLLIVFAISAFSTLTLSLYQRFPIEFLEVFFNYDSIFNFVFWPIFIVSVFCFVQLFFTGSMRLFLHSIVFLAGVSNGVMLLSPIFGIRSSLYTVFLLMVFILVIVNQITNFRLRALITIPLIILSLSFGSNVLSKYILVSEVHSIRLEQIEYYKNNPDVKEAWLIRYPIFTIHAGDIEKEDEYHMQVFKLFYGINDDVELIFYYPENGY